MAGNLLLTVYFFYKTHRLKEISRLPKVMIVLANVSGVCLLSQWIYIIVKEHDFEEIYQRFLVTITYGTCQGIVFSLLFRFLSVYVQLRAQSLNSKIIVREISWAKLYQKLFIVDQVFAYIFFVINEMAD